MINFIYGLLLAMVLSTITGFIILAWAYMVKGER